MQIALLPQLACRLRPLSLLLMLLGLAPQAWAGHGIFESYLKIGDSFYDLKASTAFTNFPAANLGSFTTDQTLTLNGAELKVYRFGGDDVTATHLFYTVYRQGSRPASPTFSSYSLPFAASLGGNDQSWNTYGGNVNLLNGLAAGTYTLEVFGRSSVNYNGGGTGFDYDNNSNNPTNYTASFTVTAAAPLPVKLTMFEAARQGQDAALRWATAMEKNSQGFEIQASTDGRMFLPLAFVASTEGRSNGPRTYAYTDQAAGKYGVRYYRLRQLDYDGMASFSPVRTVTFGQLAGGLLSATPNPFGATLTLTVQAQTAQAATLTVLNTTGRPVLQQMLDVPAGGSKLSISSLQTLPAGLYVLQLWLDGQPQQLKVLKQ
jgi:hypothetical protein